VTTLRAVGVASVLGCLLLAGPVFGQSLSDESSASGGPPPWAYSLAHDLMSPFCPGRTLAACPSPQADQLRQWILFQAAAGQTQEQIEESLFERFGDVMLSAPKAEGGWGISAYAIPIAGFLLGLGFVAWMITRLARSGGSPDPAPTPLPVKSVASTGPGISDAELERLVDEEFARS
jgi:cytochrome c-type biogenesis protein CcmH/NrfF